MKVNNKIFKALLSVEVILLAFILFAFILVQIFYPLHSAVQAIALFIAVIFIRVAFKISEAKGDTQVVGGDKSEGI